MANGTGPLGGGNARPTMADIARELGVAKITVSRALSDSPTVKESTRRLIRDTAERMGYRLNISARNLRQQRTRTIAVVIEMAPSHDRLMSEPYPLSLLGGIIGAIALLSANWLISYLAYRHPKVADLLEGEPRVLIERGEIVDAARPGEAVAGVESGHRIQEERGIGHGARHRANVRNIAGRTRRILRYQPEGGFQPVNAAEAARNPDRSRAVTSLRQRSEADGDRG